jgi:hypothetical protein
MIKQKTMNTAQLYGCINKLVTLYQAELDLLIGENNVDATTTQRNISNTLNQLVKLTTQLNKLNKDTAQVATADTITTQDQEIIDRFLEKNTKNRHC